MKKIKFCNWMMLSGATILLLGILGLIYYESSKPKIFQPSGYIIFEPNGRVVRYDPSKVNASETKWAPQVMVKVNEKFSIITDERKILNTKQKPSELQTDIKLLEEQKKNLEENISKLEKYNAQLTKISYETQQEIIRFVDRNRIIDILLSAFIGALVSAILTFVLNLSSIKEKIDNFLFYKE